MSILLLLFVDDTTKLAHAEDDVMEAIGVNADEDRTGRASNPLMPLIFSPFTSDIFASPFVSMFARTSASSNSSNGRTGNK